MSVLGVLYVCAPGVSLKRFCSGWKQAGAAHPGHQREHTRYSVQQVLCTSTWSTHLGQRNGMSMGGMGASFLLRTTPNESAHTESLGGPVIDTSLKTLSIIFFLYKPQRVTF